MIALARITPSLLITVSSSAFAERAVISTLPPSAVIVPELIAEAFTVSPGKVGVEVKEIEQ